jgi:peptide/nickel transport system permease protein
MTSKVEFKREFIEISMKRGGAAQIRRISETPWMGILIISVFVICAIFSPLLAPHDPTKQNISQTLLPPAWHHDGSRGHLLGTNALGQDVLSRLIYGARVSLMVSVSAVFLSGLGGVIIGMLSGYFGRWVDSLLMRLTDIQLSIPFILLAIALIGALGPSLQNVIIVIAITNWVAYARVARAETLVVKEREFVLSARVSGSSIFHILGIHILPNILNSCIVLATLDIGKAIIYESGLSFLGIGVQPPTTSWGLMLADGRKYISIAYWLTTFPGLAVVIVVLGGNFLGDWLRDRFDPKTFEWR